jgi:aldose sugar dehydrogenase
MRYLSGLVALLVAPAAFAASPLVQDSPLGCPPTRSLTTQESRDGADLILVQGPKLTPELIAGPFQSPRSVAFLPDGSFLVAEHPGRLQLVTPEGTGQISGVPSVLRLGHGGLIDLALDPDFANNQTLYMSYLTGTEQASVLRVMKARLDDVHETLVDETVIFESTPGDRHDQIGGRIAVTPDGYLFLTVGDRWQGDPAQDLSNDSGKIIRVRTDGSIPEDNPFRSTAGARPEIWSYGHRNPQGIAYDATRGELWSNEHGPQGGDELNLVIGGRNYGWPIITYGVDYSGRPIGFGHARPGLEQPVRYWAPISIAPSGLVVQPDPQERILWISTLAGETLVRVTLGDGCTVGEEHFVDHELGRIRNVRIDPDGALYVLTDGQDGMLYRLDPATGENGSSEKTHL